MVQDKNDGKYVSCIKINGVPILPPLITSAKRKELNKYKQQAVKLENRLKREHELREYINRYYLPKLEESSGIFSDSIEHKLSFDTTGTLTNTVVPVGTPTSNKRKPSKLSCDIQVSQYTNNEFEVLTNFENQTTHIENIFDNTEAYDKNQSTTSNSGSDVSDVSHVHDFAKPRLIRSDSYVLETPSPMLLEHMKRKQENDKELPNVPTKELGYITSTPNSCRNAKTKSPEADVNVSTRSEFFSETESELKNISDHSNGTQDDITVLSKDLTVVDNRKELVETSVMTEEPKINEEDCIKDLALDTYDEQKLKQILDDIPETYSRQIIELLEKQKKEQIARLNSYMKLKTSILDEDSLNSFCSLNNSLPVQGKSCLTDSLVPSPNKIILKSNTSHVDLMNSNNKLCNLSPKIFTQQCEAIVTKPAKCSRQLFAVQTIPYKIKEITSKQEWAASIIQAHVRGYLTRRLLKTERVQGLIQTIKDALICAMELHSENTDNINESDVELHRRLIQQVSAACYAFNDVFFNTPICEQMSVIRIDRERLKEKAKRPKSKLSLRSVSSRTSRSSR